MIKLKGNKHPHTPACFQFHQCSFGMIRVLQCPNIWTS